MVRYRKGSVQLSEPAFYSKWQKTTSAMAGGPSLAVFETWEGPRQDLTGPPETRGRVILLRWHGSGRQPVFTRVSKVARPGAPCFRLRKPPRPSLPPVPQLLHNFREPLHGGVVLATLLLGLLDHVVEELPRRLLQAVKHNSVFSREDKERRPRFDRQRLANRTRNDDLSAGRDAGLSHPWVFCKSLRVPHSFAGFE